MEAGHRKVAQADELSGLRAERISRELARVNRKLTIVVILVALPWVLAILAFIIGATGQVEFSGP